MKQEQKNKLAVIRIRGTNRIKPDIKKTLSLLKLYKNNYCRVLENTPTNFGMVRKVKDYITWGEITEDCFKELVKRKGEEYKGRIEDSKGKIKYRFLTIDNKKLKSYFRLNPPRGGLERKGIKKSFKESGALGYRGEKINDLIRKMM